MVIPGPLGTTLIRVVFENNDYVVSTRSYNCYLMMLLTNSRTHLFTECVLKKKQGQNKQRNTFWQERPYAEGCVHVVPLRMKCQHNTSLDDTLMLFYRYLSLYCNFCAAKNAAEFCSFCLKRLTFQDSCLTLGIVVLKQPFLIYSTSRSDSFAYSLRYLLYTYTRQIEMADFYIDAGTLIIQVLRS